MTAQPTNTNTVTTPRPTMIRTTTKRDAGSVLPMTLAFLALGSLVVMALLSFASTLFLNRPPLEERSDSLEAVRSSMRMAITMQRSHGPEGCFEHPSHTFAVNNRTVGVSCTVANQQNEIGGRFALIATTNMGNSSRNGAAIAATGTAKGVLNDVFVNGGSLANDATSVRIGNAKLYGSGAATPTDPNTPGALTSRYRYASISTSTKLDVSATPTCEALFGPLPLVQVQTFGPTEFDSEKDQIEVKQKPDFVEVKPKSGSTILGVIVSDPNGAVTIDRTRKGAGKFEAKGTVPGNPVAINGLTVCYQTVPSSDPFRIPDDRTFCGSPLIDPEKFTQDASRDGVDCNAKNWWDKAGWASTVLSKHVYPMLPRIPTYARSSSPLEVGTSNCYVFYPGRYENDVTLDSDKNYYFASGVYLFEGKVDVKPGANVVGGEGISIGCTYDAEASFLPGSPRNHEITGDGVTFLLGGNGSASNPSSGRLKITNASVRLNQRVATTSTRASAGVSVMSVNLKSATPVGGGFVDVEIPQNDRVLLPDCLASEVASKPSCAEDIATYSSTPVVGAPAIRYRPSQLGHDDLIIDVKLNGSVRKDNRVLFGGSVFTPNAAVSFQRSNSGSAYEFQALGGITATTMEFDFPDGGSDEFVVGKESAIVYELVKLKTTTDYDGKTFQALVDLELDNADRYAINSWVVGSEASGAGGSGGTPTTSSTTTTVAPTTSTTTTTVAPTTSTTTTTVAPTTSTTSTTVAPTISTTSTTVAPTTTAKPTTTTTVAPTTIAKPTTTTTVAPTTTAKPTTTTTTTTSTTTTTVKPTTTTSTTTTTVSPSGYDFCGASNNTWSTRFGPGVWARGDWPNKNFDGPYKYSTNPTIDVDFGSGKNPQVDKSDDFSIVWQQRIEVAKTCTIKFRAGGDDGYAFLLDRNFVIDERQDQSFNTTTKTITLTPGSHFFEFYFYENTGDARARLDWMRN